MRFLVKVSCYGSQWLVYAPAFGVSRIVSDKRHIRDEAHRMIARCGAAPSKFDIDLELGRVVDKDRIQGLAVEISENSDHP